MISIEEKIFSQYCDSYLVGYREPTVYFSNFDQKNVEHQQFKKITAQASIVWLGRLCLKKQVCNFSSTPCDKSLFGDSKLANQ